MKKDIKLWQLMGFAITSLMGTVLHFLFDWLNGVEWIAPFSSVNESTWEHMKILFWPMLLFALVQKYFFKNIEGFWCIKLQGILFGTVSIPIILSCFI